MRSKLAVAALWMACLLCGSHPVRGTEDRVEPVTPDASREARALLTFIQGLSSQYTLTGQLSQRTSGCQCSGTVATLP